jgi:hypothetical protein
MHTLLTLQWGKNKIYLSALTNIGNIYSFVNCVMTNFKIKSLPQ